MWQGLSCLSRAFMTESFSESSMTPYVNHDESTTKSDNRKSNLDSCALQHNKTSIFSCFDNSLIHHNPRKGKLCLTHHTTK